jgi:hypothetical protein
MADRRDAAQVSLGRPWRARFFPARRCKGGPAKSAHGRPGEKQASGKPDWRPEIPEVGQLAFGWPVHPAGIGKRCALAI